MQSQIRLFLLFFVTSLWSFEWQAILGKPEQIGNLAGPWIAFFMSIGSVFLICLSRFSPNLLPTKNNTIAVSLTGLSLGNLILAWSLDRSLDEIVRSLVYWTLILNAIVGQTAIAIETASIVKSSNRLELVRPFGSVGFLAAALVSQYSGGTMLYLAICVPVIIGLYVSKTRPRTNPSKSDQMQSIDLSFPKILAVAMLLGFVSRGFDAAVTQELREVNQQGLFWLTFMIVSEVVILLVSRRLSSRFVVMFAPIAWMIAYYCFLQPTSTPRIAIGMILAGFNCTWQAKLASSTEVSKCGDIVYSQYLLAGAIALGSIFFTCIPSLLGLKNLHDIIRFSSISAGTATLIIAIAFAFGQNMRKNEKD